MVFDARPKAGDEPDAPAVAGLTPWVYVLDGPVTAGGRRLGPGGRGVGFPSLREAIDTTTPGGPTPARPQRPGRRDGQSGRLPIVR